MNRSNRRSILENSTCLSIPRGAYDYMCAKVGVHLALISPSTPAARIHDWHACIQGAWLIKVGDKTIQSIKDVAQAFDILRSESSQSTTLLFLHPKI